LAQTTGTKPVNDDYLHSPSNDRQWSELENQSMEDEEIQEATIHDAHLDEKSSEKKEPIKAKTSNKNKPVENIDSSVVDLNDLPIAKRKTPRKRCSIDSNILDSTNSKYSASSVSDGNNTTKRKLRSHKDSILSQEEIMDKIDEVAESPGPSEQTRHRRQHSSRAEDKKSSKTKTKAKPKANKKNQK